MRVCYSKMQFAFMQISGGRARFLADGRRVQDAATRRTALATSARQKNFDAGNRALAIVADRNRPIRLAYFAAAFGTGCRL